MTTAVVRDDLRVSEQRKCSGVLRHFDVPDRNCLATSRRCHAPSELRQMITNRYGVVAKALKPILPFSELWHSIQYKYFVAAVLNTETVDFSYNVMAFCQITDHHIPESRNSCINLRENLKSEGYEMEPRSENLSRCFFLFIYLFIYSLLYVLLFWSLLNPEVGVVSWTVH